MKQKKRILDISKKTFLIAAAMLALFVVIAAVLTYVIPKGSFATVTNELGEKVVDYTNYIPAQQMGGIPIWKAILSPLLIFISEGNLQPIMLILFLLIIAGVFQIMSDCGAMEAIVNRIAFKFQHKKKLFLAVITLFFMLLGSLFGIFEETLIVLPMIISICARLGFDPVTGFVICTTATGFGFSAAITNPFSIVYASNLIGASISSGVLYRILIFLVFYLILLVFVFARVKRFSKPAQSMLIGAAEKTEGETRMVRTYTVFLVVVAASIIVISSISALRDLSIALLAVIFLIGGVLSGIIAAGIRKALKGFWNGASSALPAMLLVCFAFAVKYVLTAGMVLDTITHEIAVMVESKPPYATILILFAIIMFLEFFITSSTAKAAFVMGILSGVATSGSLHLSRELIVLIYIFSDGITNIILPTSPILLLGLSMTDQDYFSWLKRSKFLFLAAFAVAFAFLFLGLVIGY